ncbi:MAG: DUF3606 domain-containing protein [Pseudomonadota bacterium]
MHRRARDRTRIKAYEPLEVRYWATTLRCTQDELRAAITIVGSGAEVVRKYLHLVGVRIV